MTKLIPDQKQRDLIAHELETSFLWKLVQVRVKPIVWWIEW